MITAAHFEKVLRSIPKAMGRQVASLEDLAEGANDALLSAPESLTVEGAAAFLATLSQESASFRTTEEYSKTGRYRPYIGRTFEQITWKDNYAAFGAWCEDRGLCSDSQIFVKDFKSLADLRWAWLGGIWFWEKNGIWAYSDNFLKTQKAVNLGNPNSIYTPAGMVVRNQWYNAWLQLGEVILPQRNQWLTVHDAPLISNEWADKADRPMIDLKTSRSRRDAELISESLSIEALQNLLKEN